MTPEAIALEIERTDAKTVLGTPEGRRWVFALAASCGVGFDQHLPTDPIELQRAAGRHDIGTNVMQRLAQLAPAEYRLMVVEAAQAAAEAEMREQLKR